MQSFSSLTGKKSWELMGLGGFGMLFFPKICHDNLEFIVLHLASKQDTLLRLLATERAAE